MFWLLLFRFLPACEARHHVFAMRTAWGEPKRISNITLTISVSCCVQLYPRSAPMLSSKLIHSVNG